MHVYRVFYQIEDYLVYCRTKGLVSKTIKSYEQSLRLFARYCGAATLASGTAIVVGGALVITAVYQGALVLQIKYSKIDKDGPKFFEDLGKLIDNGTFKFVGRGTLNKTSEVYKIYRGEGLTLVIKENNEWVTLLEQGKGMDLNIMFIE